MTSADSTLPIDVGAHVEQRRTFAIISHPDAGKTTLTEKLLLYSGMIRTAGMVGGRKGNKSASSDWMAMEQERGISVTSSAMQFRYRDVTVNILDTPGHQDFSEDTYRTLTAADSVIMVLDAAKGVETQTRKLFEACRLRKIPVITFINKMDLPGRDPIDLMHEVEQTLNIQASAKNWPVGMGREFVGVVERESREIQIFQKMAERGSAKAGITRSPLDEPTDLIDADQLEDVREQVELLDIAGNEFDRASFLDFEVTPVFFGSALTNFGVEPLFDALVDLAPPPHPRPADLEDGSEQLIDPADDMFSAFVFKLQANMNPQHRDCIAFLRINSGRFEKDMTIWHHRLKKKVRMSRPHSLMVSERARLEEAYPGDIIGVINPGVFVIGDTISSSHSKASFQFKAPPRFQPELFARIRPKDLGKRKAIQKGLEQLAAEGAVQILKDLTNPGGYPLIAAVGRLQFEVLQYRLEDEYKAKSVLEAMPYTCSAWIEGDLKRFDRPSTAILVEDYLGRPMVLFTDRWQKKVTLEQHPDHTFLDYA